MGERQVSVNCMMRMPGFSKSGAKVRQCSCAECVGASSRVRKFFFLQNSQYFANSICRLHFGDEFECGRKSNRMSIERENCDSSVGSCARRMQHVGAAGNHSRSKNINDSFRLNRRNLQKTSSDDCCCAETNCDWSDDCAMRKLNLILRGSGCWKFDTDVYCSRREDWSPKFWIFLVFLKCMKTD